jgi:hypothetical protein
MAGYDGSTLPAVFDAAAKSVQQARLPSIEKIMAEIGYKFDNNVFTVKIQKGRASQVVISTGSGNDLKSIMVAEEGDGTFRVYLNGREAFQHLPVDKAVQSIGQFYGQYSDIPPPAFKKRMNNEPNKPFVIPYTCGG